jgi:hypothetical protein
MQPRQAATHRSTPSSRAPSPPHLKFSLRRTDGVGSVPAPPSTPLAGPQAWQFATAAGRCRQPRSPPRKFRGLGWQDGRTWRTRHSAPAAGCEPGAPTATHVLRRHRCGGSHRRLLDRRRDNGARQDEPVRERALAAGSFPRAAGRAAATTRRRPTQPVRPGTAATEWVWGLARGDLRRVLSQPNPHRPDPAAAGYSVSNSASRDPSMLPPLRIATVWGVDRPSVMAA